MELSKKLISFFNKKTVLVTGSCGTVGSKIVETLADIKSVNLICIDNNENKIFTQSKIFDKNKNVSTFFVDIKDITSLFRLNFDVDYIIHTAANKHVEINEYTPWETINNNVIGTQNIIDFANRNNVKKMLFTSSDKSVNPTNVMGTTKLLSEKLITACNANSKVKFSTVRFGNILNSNGSVLTIFNSQGKNNLPITLTDPEMSRFIMTIDQAVNLVLTSLAESKGGEIFVTKMNSILINDLAKIYSELYDVPISIVGPRPGEKKYEELFNSEEINRMIVTDKFYVIYPSYRIPQSPNKINYFNSETTKT